MNINHLKKRVKRLFHEKFNRIKYGDAHRVPYPYLATKSTKEPFYGYLPDRIPPQDHQLHSDFPTLSKTLLLDLFAQVGVHYLPEICFHQLDHLEPLEIFYNFAITFGVPIEHRVEERYLLDVTLLNRVIDYLRLMDKIRMERLFDSRPVYKLLSEQKFEAVERLLKEKM